MVLSIAAKFHTLHQYKLTSRTLLQCMLPVCNVPRFTILLSGWRFIDSLCWMFIWCCLFWLSAKICHQCSKLMLKCLPALFTLLDSWSMPKNSHSPHVTLLSKIRACGFSCPIFSPNSRLNLQLCNATAAKTLCCWLILALTQTSMFGSGKMFQKLHCQVWQHWQVPNVHPGHNWR